MSTPGGQTVNTTGLSGANIGGNIGQIIASLISGYGALTGSANTNAQQLASVADPQSGVRQTGITQLNQILQNPESYLQDPVIQASIAQGVQGVDRQFGALGAGDSGGVLAAMQSQGQQTAYGDLSSRISQLLGISNLGNPVAAANLLGQGQANQATNVAGALAGLGPLGSIIQQLISGAGGLPGGIGNIGGAGSGYGISTDPNAVPIGAATPGTDIGSIVPGSPDFLPDITGGGLDIGSAISDIWNMISG